MSTIALARKHAPRVRWISIAVLVVALLYVSRSLPLAQGMQALRAWIDGLGIWGPVAYGLIYVAATVLFVPGSLITLAGGAIFGLLVGTIVVSVSSVTGAALAFLIARYLARDKVVAMARQSSKFDAVDRAIGEGGWRIVALLRLSPAVPFNLQNYLFGLTPVSFGAYVLTSWIAMLPGTFLYVYVGHVTGAAVAGGRERTAAEWILLAVGLLATLAVTVYVTILARRQLHAKTGIETADENPGPASSAEEENDGWPWGATIAALLAILAVAGAGWVHANPSALAGLFGPKRVELREAYAANPSGPSFDHSRFGALLAAYVDDAGWVDYPGLLEDEAALDGYLDAVAAAPFDAMGRDEKLALLINAYNAATLKLILDHWPVDSIKDIPADERWGAVRWTVGGNTWSLDQIEHEQIRPRFAEPRVHFVLVCAAAGCPPLAREPFEADRLDDQLTARSLYVHDHPTWLQYDSDAGVLRLTPLYDWYGDDFRQAAGSILAFVARYSPPVAGLLDRGGEPEIAFLDYDWSLNSQANRKPR